MKVHLCDVCEHRLPAYGHTAITVHNVVHAPSLAPFKSPQAIELCEGCANAVGAAMAARKPGGGARL